MLLTESALRKIIAEEFDKLKKEGGFHGPLSTKLGLQRGDENTLPYSDILSHLKYNEDAIVKIKLRDLLNHVTGGNKEKLKNLFDREGVNFRGSADNKITVNLKDKVKQMIDKL